MESSAAQLSPRLPFSKVSTLIPILTGAAAFALGATVLVGWQLGIDSIKRILPPLVCMNPLTALNFIMAGTTLIIYAIRYEPRSRLFFVAQFLAILITATGLVKLIACAGGPDLHVDHIMYPHDLLTGGPSLDGGLTHSPNNMAPNTAFLFALAGAALFCTSAQKRWARISAALIGMIIALISLSAAIGYFNGVASLYRPTTQVPIALHSIAGFLLLAVGIVAKNARVVLRRHQEEGDNPILAVQRKITIGFSAALFLLAVIALVACASIHNFAAASRLDADGKQAMSQAESIRSERITTGVIAAGMLLALVMVGLAGWVIQRDLEKRKTIDAKLKKAQADADEANAAKSRFLANMSHEIRTPMAAIIGYADLILDANQSASDRLDYINTIRRNGDHLLTVINDVLDLSKIEAGKFQIERVSCCPCQVLSDVASLMRVRAVEKLIRLEVKNEGLIPATIHTDPARLRQILINLVGNAIKFTEEGWVRLIMRLEEPAGAPARLRFDVIDTGIGMSKPQIGQLFQPFVQADGSVTRRFGGTGLGLTISKRLADMLGGAIEVDSSPGRGSTFSVFIDPGPLDGVERLKNCREALAGIVSPHEKQTASLSGRILLVDDGADNRRLLSVYLREAGLTVSLAENGRIGCDDALAALAHGEPFDVILMDMQMPELDGYGATAYLRSKGYTLPIVALTAHAMAEDRDRCIKAGCTDYLSKPTRRDTLISTIAKYLSTGAAPPAQSAPAAAPATILRPCRAKGPIRSQLSDESLRPFLETYVQELPGHVTEITALLAASNLKDLTTRVHNLRGTGGLYGLMPITDAAGRVETLLHAQASVEAITNEVNGLLDIIRRVEGYAEKQKTATPTPGNPQPMM